AKKTLPVLNTLICSQLGQWPNQRHSHPKNKQQKLNALKARAVLDESRTLSRRRARWMDRDAHHETIPTAFTSCICPKDNCISEKVITTYDLSLIHTLQQSNAKPQCRKQMWRLTPSSLKKTQHSSERPSNPRVHLLGRLQTF